MGRSQRRRESNSSRREESSRRGKELVGISRLGKDDIEGVGEDGEEVRRDVSMRG